MPRRGEPLGPQKQGLTLFGEWVDTFCTILDVTQARVAVLAAIDKSTVSYFTRETPRKVSPSPESVRKLWLVFVQVAEERGFPLTPSLEEGFINASGHASEAQLEVSRRHLVLLKKAAQDRRELNAILARFQEMEKIIEEQKREITRLQNELREERLRQPWEKDRS